MRARFTAFLVLTALASSVVLYLAMGKFVYLAFDRIERTEAATNLSVAVAAVRNEARSLNTWVKDYAPWDETYAFAGGEDPDFVARNFAADSIENFGFDMILIVDNSGSVLWSYLTVSTSVDELSITELPILAVNNDNWESTLGVTGIHLMSPDEAYLLAAHPILTTDARGPTRGTLIFGRILDNASFEDMIKSSVPDFNLQLIRGEEDLSGLPSEIAANSGIYYSRDASDRIFASTVLFDLNDQPRVVVQAASHRDATAHGTKAILAVSSVMAIFWILALIVWWIFSRRVRHAETR